MITLAGKTALVTGGARGIGRAIAETLAACGARVAIADLDLGAAEKTAAEIGTAASGFACDVSDPAAVTALVQTGEEAFGALDILVNNAGITRDNLMARMKDEDWDAVMAVNLRSAFVATRAVQRGMGKRRWGRIINIASVVGLMGNKGQANYAASKAGLIGLTKSAAKELASRNILVNAIAPGFIQTAMTEKLPEEARTALAAQIPLARLGEPKDIANAVAFLASDLAAYITGQVLVVDGGMVM
jgi:3-oxoacyl-[acyl-carrier protein] reductase